jgi:hypothetical protein
MGAGSTVRSCAPTVALRSADTNHSNKDNQHPATMMMKESRQQEEEKNDRKDRNLSLLGPHCAKVGL